MRSLNEMSVLFELDLYIGVRFSACEYKHQCELSSACEAEVAGSFLPGLRSRTMEAICTPLEEQVSRCVRMSPT